MSYLFELLHCEAGRNLKIILVISLLYIKNKFVWIPDPDAVWVSAQLLQDYAHGDKHLLLQLSNGKVRHAKLQLGSPPDLPPLGNPDILEGENDLTALSFLHEPAVLHNLRVRFLDYSSIYTYCGIVLVAINPYEQLHIYGEEVIDAYSGQDMADMEPHIFSVAEEAYRTMTREEKNQSIIISGESGSGKTVSAKFTMRYFAVVGGAAQQTSVEDRVLASNPIMESIGNAKTTRNDNSSRFGKYIEIGFGRKGDIIGAKMRTYLLEKSRVVFQASAERNYHIFYQLCASRELPEMRCLKLDAPERFRYTSQGGEMQIPGADDLSDLECTRNAFTVLGVQPHQQMELFRVLSAVLHLGNVNIQASGRSSDRSYIEVNDRALAVFSKLLGVEGPQMAHWLCHRRLAVGGEMLVKPRTGQQAAEARDALAKHIYGQLFTWTVQRLNSALRTQRGQSRSFIGVLDIYGFETFDRNSFEQFCINYANEKLQQQFNRHVFHLEQEEYLREELAWSRIEFIDNQLCINLIEGQLGLFDLLDEECRMPKGSDESWVRKLYDQHLSSKPQQHFQKPRMSNSAFIVLHFADTVQYECEGFLDKNRGTVFEELVNILKASQVQMCKCEKKKSSFTSHRTQTDRGLPGFECICACQFRQSLQMLMDTLNSTTPHYVRCIKPNDLKEAFIFDPKRTVQQLRACGVLETIRISAAGYPSRWTYEEFFSRYRVLLRGPQSQEQAQASCRRTLPQVISDPDQYCFGKTKVFFRAGQVALLERLRAERLRVAAVTIQSRVRGWLSRIRYTRILWATVTIQRHCRGALARRLALTLRFTKAALVIQRTYRMVVVRRLFLMIRQATVTIQAFTRGKLARRRYRQLVAERAAVLLQARVRGWLARQAYRRVRAAVVFMQCCVRRRAARRELLQLKTEARSVERYRELNKGMEVKLMQLQLRADQEVGEGLSERVDPVMSRGHFILYSHDEKCVSLCPGQRECFFERDPLQTLQREKESFDKERQELSARLLEQEKAQEECVHQAVSQASAALRVELDEERRKHQGLLREFTRLEQRYDNLREMSLLTERTNGHRRTDSSLSLEPLSPSPTALSPQCLTPLSLSPFPSAFPSPEEVRRVTGTSPCLERRLPFWSSETPMMFVFTFSDPPSALTPETLSCPSRPQSASVTGLLECRKRDETKLMKNLITGETDPYIRVDSALSLPPGLPASVLFLCVRQADCSRDQAHARSLCSAAVTAVKAALKTHDSSDLVPLTTDLSDLIRALSDLCIQAYQQLLSITETHLQNIIVPALLETETIPGLSGSAMKLGASRKRTASDPRTVAGVAPTMALVLRELGALHTALSHQALPTMLVEQAFQQLTYLISASVLNSLLLRKDMCCWTRGIQIRYNVSLLEEWLRSRDLQAGGAVAPLEPLIQAAQLLQTGKKTEAEAKALVQTCTALSSQQIVKILTLYTPHSDLEERVTLNFIRTVQVLKSRSPPQLLMDVRRVFPVTFPDLPPAALRAEQLVIPDSLKISFLRRA
uniref:Methyl-CpG binding domain protein 3b n=1 Tax=Scophthalmus maximus TaxID=52904 RepID=A0A8D3CD60_SCOMX